MQCSPSSFAAAHPLIVYLCPREVYERKMSRVRFHAMRALARLTNLVWTGPGWPRWDDTRSVQANLDRILEQREPQIIVAYKALELRGLTETRAPRCLRFNEMYDVNATRREILESGAELVICHHRNDFLEWRERLRREGHTRPRLVHIAHCAEASIFKDYGVPKSIDLMLVGACNVHSMLGQHYPLRDAMPAVLERLSSRYRCARFEHPGYEHNDAWTDRYAIDFARAVSATKICITCSGAPRSRYGKYVEVPMCGTALAADLPDEAQKALASFVIELDATWSQERLCATLSAALEDPVALEARVQRGLAYAQLYTQEQYAQRFLRELRLHLATRARVAAGEYEACKS